MIGDHPPHIADAAQHESDKDRADIEAILADTDLSETIENIKTARKRSPENAARALKLLDLIGMHRPVEGLIEDATRFTDARDAAHVLGVAAIHRSVAETAGILLAKWPSDLASEVARTFGRQRATLDIPRLIRSLREAGPGRKTAVDGIIGAILDEFAWGDTRPRDAGRPIRDISLVHVRLTGERCHEEADALLSRVFLLPRAEPFTHTLAMDLFHDAPQRDVIGDWALRRLHGDDDPSRAISVMRDLLRDCEPCESSWLTRHVIRKVGTRWPAKSLTQLCLLLTECGCEHKAAEIRRHAASRSSLRYISELIDAWWRYDGLEHTRTALLAEVVERPRRSPMSVQEVLRLADRVAADRSSDTSVPDKLRLNASLTGCSGAAVAELVQAQAEHRRKLANDIALRLAQGAKDGEVEPKEVAAYLNALRQQGWKGSRQAGNDVCTALTGRFTSDPKVVALVAVSLSGAAAPTRDGDADAILVRFLTNYSVATVDDVVTVYTNLGKHGIPGEYVSGLNARTVGRWPVVHRRRAGRRLEEAGMPDLAQQLGA